MRVWVCRTQASIAYVLTSSQDQEKMHHATHFSFDSSDLKMPSENPSRPSNRKPTKNRRFGQVHQHNSRQANQPQKMACSQPSTPSSPGNTTVEPTNPTNLRRRITFRATTFRPTYFGNAKPIRKKVPDNVGSF